MARRRGPEPTPGFLLVDKPAGWTSHDVVARVRRLAATSKVGHAGTLDPMATGVLVVGIGKATKLLTYVVGATKQYTATIRLGQATITDDAEGEITSQADASRLTADQVEAAIAPMRGDIMQVPSSVSAIKVDGQRAYAKVRGGDQVRLQARPVTVSAFTVTGLTTGDAVMDVDVEVTVSSGTYVRALARDLGEALGVGGHLTALRRTRVGPWSIDSTHSLDELAQVADSGQPLPLISPALAAEAVMPVRPLTSDEAQALSYGQFIDGHVPDGADVVAGVSAEGVLVAVLGAKRGKLAPEIVFEPAGQRDSDAGAQ